MVLSGLGYVDPKFRATCYLFLALSLPGNLKCISGCSDSENGPWGTEFTTNTESNTSCKVARIQVWLEQPEAGVQKSIISAGSCCFQEWAHGVRHGWPCDGVQQNFRTSCFSFETLLMPLHLVSYQRSKLMDQSGYAVAVRTWSEEQIIDVYRDTESIWWADQGE